MAIGKAWFGTTSLPSGASMAGVRNGTVIEQGGIRFRGFNNVLQPEHSPRRDSRDCRSQVSFPIRKQPNARASRSRAGISVLVKLYEGLGDVSFASTSISNECACAARERAAAEMAPFDSSLSAICTCGNASRYRCCRANALPQMN